LQLAATGSTGTLTGNVRTVTVPFSGLGLGPYPTNGQTRGFRGSDYAVFDNTLTTWTNQTTLTNLAQQFAIDWYTSQTAPFDIVFAGIVAWQPAGLSDSIEWTYLRDKVCTRVQRPSYNDNVESVLRAALGEKPSAEKRRRVQALLRALPRPQRGRREIAPEERRLLCVAVLLDRIGTPDALDLLRYLADATDLQTIVDDRSVIGRETIAAKAVLARLAKRPAKP
jgi:hypothetical protein